MNEINTTLSMSTIRILLEMTTVSNLDLFFNKDYLKIKLLPKIISHHKDYWYKVNMEHDELFKYKEQTFYVAIHDIEKLIKIK